MTDTIDTLRRFYALRLFRKWTRITICWERDHRQKRVEVAVHNNVPRMTFLERKLLDFQGSAATFRQRFRLPLQTAMMLLALIRPLLEHPTKRNKALTPEQQLLGFLHLFGFDYVYHVARDLHGPSVATISRVMKRVSTAIIPTTGNFLYRAQAFSLNKTHFLRKTTQKAVQKHNLRLV